MRLACRSRPDLRTRPKTSCLFPAGRWCGGDGSFGVHVAGVGLGDQERERLPTTATTAPAAGGPRLATAAARSRCPRDSPAPRSPSGFSEVRWVGWDAGEQVVLDQSIRAIARPTPNRVGLQVVGDVSSNSVRKRVRNAANRRTSTAIATLSATSGRKAETGGEESPHIPAREGGDLQRITSSPERDSNS